jgi:tRNA (adenine22-N1)-methyltransferase
MPPTLSARLATVAGLVPACARLVDVGTDHALLPIVLVAAGRCATALARDLRLGPVAVARRNIARARLESRIEAEVADGLAGLTCTADDVVVVAGLGGLETADILERSLEASRAVRALVLQPMKSLPELRVSLETFGFVMEREEMVRDAGRHYVVLRCRALRPDETLPPRLDALEALLGRDLLARRPPSFQGYVAWIRRRLEKECRGLSASASAEDRVGFAERQGLIARIDALTYNE